MEHLVRAGGLLAAVLVATALLILLPRFVSTPEILDDYGFYGGGDNSEEWADWQGQYADSSTCNGCHEDQYTLWIDSQHSSVVCETCHGPGREHMENGAAMETEDSREFCGICHGVVLGRPDGFPQVDLGGHGGSSACTTCNNPNDTGFESIDIPAVPHGLEGRAECTLCHGEDGIMPFPGDHSGLSSETCLRCHDTR